MNPLSPPPVFYGLLALLAVLVIFHQLRERLNPIIAAVVSGLAKNAQTNATAYAIAFGFGLSASLSAFVDVFKDLSAAQATALSYHQYAALWAKVANPFIVAILAYATQSKFKQPTQP